MKSGPEKKICFLFTKATSKVAYSFLMSLPGSNVFVRLAELGYLEVELRLVDLDFSRVSAIACELMDQICPVRLTVSRWRDDDPIAYDGVDLVFIIGGFHESEKRLRNQYLIENAQLMKRHGRMIAEATIDKCAAIIVVANPVNLNCMVLNASISGEHSIFGLSLLDQVRAQCWIAQMFRCAPVDVEGVFAVGNHSGTVTFDTSRLTIKGDTKVLSEREWLNLQTAVRNRGQEIISLGGHNSVGSAAVATLRLTEAVLFGSDGLVSAVTDAEVAGAPWISVPIQLTRDDIKSKILVERGFYSPHSRYEIAGFNETINELQRDIQLLQADGIQL